MSEQLKLTAIRREQRRIAALIGASNQLGLVLPARQGGIVFQDLYKSKYYHQMKAGVGQMYVAKNHQQQTTLSAIEHLLKRRKKPTSVLSPSSSVTEGWKHLREVRERRDNLAKRKQFRTKQIGGDRRLFEAPDGPGGWSPGQAARELVTQKMIRNNRQTNDINGQQFVKKSGGSQTAILFERLPNRGGGVDFRLPRMAKFDQSSEISPDFTQQDNQIGDDSSRINSITSKLLLRYNHGSKGKGENLSVQGQAESVGGGSEDAVTSYDWSVYSDSPDDSYRPFYPQTPSASPASIDLVDGFDLRGLGRVFESDNRHSDVNTNLTGNGSGEGGSGCTDYQMNSSSSTQRMKQVRRGGDAEFNSNAATKPEVLSPHFILNQNQNRRDFSRESKKSSTSMDAYRDAYERALAVARSRRLPNDFTGLEARTTRAFSFSYFADDHGPTCKCQRCLEGVLHRHFFEKKVAKKRRQQPQGLKLILGDVRIEDYYTQ